MVKTTNIDNKGKTRKSKKLVYGNDCSFPFKFKGKIYNDCVKGNTGDWCATSKTKNGYTDTWAYCSYNKTPIKSNSKSNSRKSTSKRSNSKSSTSKRSNSKSSKSSIKSSSSSIPPMVVGFQYFPVENNGKIKPKYLNKEIILVRKETNKTSMVILKVTKEKYRYKLLVKAGGINAEGVKTKIKPYVAWWKPSRGITDQNSPSTFLQNMLEDGYKIDKVR